MGYVSLTPSQDANSEANQVTYEPRNILHHNSHFLSEW